MTPEFGMSCDCMSLDVNAVNFLVQSLSNFLSTNHKNKFLHLIQYIHTYVIECSEQCMKKMLCVICFDTFASLQIYFIYFGKPVQAEIN